MEPAIEVDLEMEEAMEDAVEWVAERVIGDEDVSVDKVVDEGDVRATSSLTGSQICDL